MCPPIVIRFCGSYVGQRCGICVATKLLDAARRHRCALTVRMSGAQLASARVISTLLLSIRFRLIPVAKPKPKGTELNDRAITKT